MSGDIVPGAAGRGDREAGALDHAREFTERVLKKAAEEYQDLLASGRFDGVLGVARGEGGGFNHGKLLVYAQYRVFRREFQRRFPQAGEPACINAFCGLFLKNDISINNLLEFAEADSRTGPDSLEPPN